MKNDRVAGLLAHLKQAGAPCALIANPNDVLWLSGFRGSSAALLLTPNRRELLTDFRYVEQARREAPGFEIVEVERGLLEGGAERVKKARVKKVAVQTSHLSADLFAMYRQKLAGVEVVSEGGILSRLRAVKDDGEIRLIADAVRAGEKVLEQVLPLVRAGMTEADLASELVYRFRKVGGETESFLPIVASGPNSSCPHHIPGSRKLKRGDLLKIDFGLRRAGYCSDMTRTFFVGKIGKKERALYDVVLAAQEAALSGARPGMTGQAIDALARDVIAKAGYADRFGHGLGHGIGLQVHEAPTISTKGTTPVEPGMVFTVEPGVYLPGFGGVRIEDVVVVTETGARNLTRFPKEPLALG